MQSPPKRVIYIYQFFIRESTQSAWSGLLEPRPPRRGGRPVALFICMDLRGAGSIPASPLCLLLKQQRILLRLHFQLVFRSPPLTSSRWFREVRPASPALQSRAQQRSASRGTLRKALQVKDSGQQVAIFSKKKRKEKNYKSGHRNKIAH